MTTKELVVACYSYSPDKSKGKDREIFEAGLRLALLDEQVHELVELVRDCSECSVFMVKPALREFIKLHPELFARDLPLPSDLSGPIKHEKPE